MAGLAHSVGGHRVLSYAALALAMSLAGCSGNGLLVGTYYEAPVAAPPDYYPGQQFRVYDKPAWERWQADNRAAMLSIGAQTLQIRAGKSPGGCIGYDRLHCVATLAQTLALTDDLNSDLYAPETVDVNGRSPPQRMISSLVAYVPTIFRPPAFPGDKPRATPMHLVLTLDEKRLVSQVQVSLLRNPFLTVTQKDYDATGTIEPIAALTMAGCPGQSRNDIARFIENSVKPQVRVTDDGQRRGHAYIAETGDIPFCGRELSFVEVEGRGDLNRSRDNPAGLYGGTMLRIR